MSWSALAAALSDVRKGRVSRPCYDKMHRCPGWAGGGNHYAKVDRCDNGSLPWTCFEGRWWRWRCNRCQRCGLLVWPYMIRYVDPTNWRSEITMTGWRIRQWFEWRQIRRERRRWRRNAKRAEARDD